MSPGTVVCCQTTLAGVLCRRGETTMEATPEMITTEAALRALTRPQRRAIIDELAATSVGTTLEQLEAALDGTDVTGTATAAQLHHVHLPLLQDAHIVEYDADRRTVRPGEHFEEVLSLYRLFEAHGE